MNAAGIVLLRMPAVLLLVLAVALMLLIACGGQSLVHRRFSDRDFLHHNEVAGFIIAVAGTLYAVVLGFLTVVAWEHFADARQRVALESAAAADVWHAAVGLPRDVRQHVRQDIVRYATLVLDQDWPKMRDGGFDMSADMIVMDAITTAGTFVPANAMQSNSQNATLTQLGNLHDDRQLRLADNEGGIVPFEWLVLLIGAATVVAFCWLFGMDNARVHLLMTGAVTVIITSLLVLLFELQYPFRSDLRIGPDSWVAVLNHIRVMQSTPNIDMRM